MLESYPQPPWLCDFCKFSEWWYHVRMNESGMTDAERDIYDSRTQITRCADGRWKKGQSGNPLGRPKGKTMKEWAKEYLSRMNDEERDEWMDGIPKDIIWRMAEGNPRNESDITTGGDKLVFLPPEIIDKHNLQQEPEVE